VVHRRYRGLAEVHVLLRKPAGRATTVEFDITQGQKGPQAANVRLLERQ
jgi:'Cold-shock' DNA-binding domain